MKTLCARPYLYLITVILLYSQGLLAQCGVGYTQAQVNWDKLDYYFNGTKPYNSYVSNTMEQTQKFALGPNYVTIATSSSNIVNPGTADGVSAENGTHTGNLTNYTGADVQYNPSADGQYVTLTFNEEVTNLNFTLYDIDGSQRIDFAATNAASVAQNINITIQASTILTITNNNSTSPYVAATSGTLANNSNQGSATITVNGPVKQLVFTYTTVGADGVTWLSDINACVTGSFPSLYNRTPDNEPFLGPAGNQPDYFLITPDNDYCYMVDPATGVARPLFQDPSKDFLNSFGYDPYNHYLYYISENSTIDANNKTLKRYDFNTESYSTILADLTSLNIPVMNQGVETAGAAYYNGKLFIGFEGGQYNSSNTRESIVYRLDLDGSGIPINAVQVFAVNSYNGGSGTHDWADFVIEDGVLVNYNSRVGTTMVAYEHYNMMTGQSTQYLNPSSTTGFAYQAGLTWAGDQYSFSSRAITKYNENGTVGTPITITNVGGGTFQSGAGDASENFRPKCDFGDAPSSYDPVANSPAVHERSDNLRLGAVWDSEWLKTGGAGATADGGDEDGVATVPVLDTGYFNYAIDVDVFNNTGVNATVSAWLDYNANGVFDVSEGVTASVGTSASMQTVTLVWWVINTPLTLGQSTYLRVRITSADKNMGTAHPTGYYDVGEVEDYEVMVDAVLPIILQYFKTTVVNNRVNLDWKTSGETSSGLYLVERSADGVNWEEVTIINAFGTAGDHLYAFVDSFPLPGQSFYRLAIKRRTDGSLEAYSPVRTVHFSVSPFVLKLQPNPVQQEATLTFMALENGMGKVRIFTQHGTLLMEKAVIYVKGSNEVVIPDIGPLRPGNYILQLATPEGVFATRFLKN